MPNDCWNFITIKATNEQIRTILTTEFTSVPKWAFDLRQVGEEALIFTIWSRCTPDKKLIHYLLDKYEDLWVKNEWSEEGGFAGIIVGTKGNLKEMEWEEGCIEEWSHRLRETQRMPAPVLAAMNQ